MSSPSVNSSDEVPAPLVIFDGICVLCNRAVSWCIRWDTQRKLLFTSNSSATAQKLLSAFGRSGVEQGSVLFFDGTSLLSRTDAVIGILSHVSYPYRALTLVRFVPRFIRDLVYTCIAVSRYRVFGKTTECQLLTPEQRSRLIL